MQMLHKARATACAGVLTLGCTTAHANFTCEGPVSYLGLSPEGLITVSVGFGAWYVCNQTTAMSFRGVAFSPEGGRAWYAAILAAQKTEQSIRFFFSSAATTNNGAKCGVLGNWTWPDPAPYDMTVM
jgi:hypothetical protein